MVDTFLVAPSPSLYILILAFQTIKQIAWMMYDESQVSSQVHVSVCQIEILCFHWYLCQNSNHMSPSWSTLIQNTSWIGRALTNFGDNLFKCWHLFVFIAEYTASHKTGYLCQVAPSLLAEYEPTQKMRQPSKLWNRTKTMRILTQIPVVLTVW